jgi:hypothetical protein
MVPKPGWNTAVWEIAPIIVAWPKLLLIDFQGQNMTPEREMIVWAVLEGKLPEQMLTQEEVDEVMVLVQEAIMDKRLQEAEAAGNPSVFWGFDEDTLH